MSQQSKLSKLHKDAQTSGGDGGQDAEERSGWFRFLLGWVVAPGSVVAVIVLAGVHVGANHPDMFLSRLLLWMFGGGD